MIWALASFCHLWSDVLVTHPVHFLFLKLMVAAWELWTATVGSGPSWSFHSVFRHTDIAGGTCVFLENRKFQHRSQGRQAWRMLIKWSLSGLDVCRVVLKPAIAETHKRNRR